MRVTVSMEAAPAFLAGLVREGVTFNAWQQKGEMVIEFAGGY